MLKYQHIDRIEQKPPFPSGFALGLDTKILYYRTTLGNMLKIELTDEQMEFFKKADRGEI